MSRDNHIPNAALRRPSSLPLNVQVKHTVRRQIKFLSRSSTRQQFFRSAPFVLLVILLIAAAVFYVKTRPPHYEDFDDVADMKLLEQEDALYLEQRRNESESHFVDPLSKYNITEVKESRRNWDFIYGELVRKYPPVTLTKYKTRLLRELLKSAQYKMVSKFSPAIDVSCNYLNDLGTASSPHAFTCTPTSHQCPDGKFSLRKAFAAREGSSITWDEVVIVMMISEGREDFIRAAAETWIPRLRKEATLFLFRDRQLPELPRSILHRPNTYIYAYMEDVGLENLDYKALDAWATVHSLFGRAGKKYFLKIDDDAFLVGHNLIRFLNKVEHMFSGTEEALYFGHPFCGHGDLKAMGYEKWCYAGGGAYGLSIEALTIFLKQVKGGCVYFYDYIMKAPDKRPENDRYGGHYEDVMVGRCMRQAKDRFQRRGTSLLACGSFVPYAPLHYYEAFGRSKDAMSRKLDGDLITIHNLEPSAIRFLDHLLYEYPLGGKVGPFSPESEHLQELIDLCHMEGKKMRCDLSKLPSMNMATT